MGTLLHGCAEVRELIELSFGVVSGISPGIHVIEKRAILGIFQHLCPIDFNGQNDVFFARKCIRLLREKLIIFPYGH